MSTTTQPTPLTAAAATAARLRALAELVTRAEDRGVPIPDKFHVHHHLRLGGVTFQATEHQYAAWCEFLEASTRDTYVLDGIRWHSAAAQTAGGLVVEWYAGSPIDLAPGEPT